MSRIVQERGDGPAAAGVPAARTEWGGGAAIWCWRSAVVVCLMNLLPDAGYLAVGGSDRSVAVLGVCLSAAVVVAYWRLLAGGVL